MLVLRVFTTWWVWPVIFLLWSVTIALLTNLYRDTFQSSTSSNEEWLTIWKNKGVFIGDDEPLHHADGFNAIDIDQWNTLVTTVIKSEGRERFRPNDTVIDFGCGAGAFLDSLKFNFN